MRKNFRLLSGEELHTLIDEQLYILQRTDQFRFGIDAVLLANWVKVRVNDKVIDLGTGSGIIPLLLVYKQNLQHILGVEINKEMVDLAQRSVELNQLEDQIQILHYDLCRLKQIKSPNSYSLVISNPPYFPVGCGELNPNEAKALARHEISCTLMDLIETAAYLLGTGGRFVMIHRVERIPEIIQKLSLKRLEVKALCLIQPTIKQNPNLVLLEAVMDGKPGLKIEPNLVVYDQSGKYTPELRKMYNGIGGSRIEC